MPEYKQALILNTTPIITFSIAAGSLDMLRALYDPVIVPYEVQQEIQAGGADAPGFKSLLEADWIDKRDNPVNIATYLRNTLDIGESSVIQTATNEGIRKVCIDEKVGRRVARLNGLTVVGSIGIIAKSIQQGEALEARKVLERLKSHGIWLGKDVEDILLNPSC